MTLPATTRSRLVSRESHSSRPFGSRNGTSRTSSGDTAIGPDRRPVEVDTHQSANAASGITAPRGNHACVLTASSIGGAPAANDRFQFSEEQVECETDNPDHDHPDDDDVELKQRPPPDHH